VQTRSGPRYCCSYNTVQSGFE